MKHDRRTLLSLTVLLAACGVAPCANAAADSFPSKTVTLVVPFAAGGNVDVAARMIAGPLGKILGQPVVVENRTGASGAIAAAYVARAPADGHTLFIGNPGQIATVPLLNKTGYTAASFKPVGLISKTSLLLVARSADPNFKNFAQFRAYAGSKRGLVNAANPGHGSPNHLALLQLEKAAELKFNAIAYRGSAPALTDLVGGQIEVSFDQITSSLPFIKSGSLRALAVMGPSRDAALPDVPTLDQVGVSGIDATTYVGLFAPVGLPPAVLSVLSNALREVVQSPVVAAGLGQLGSQAYAGSANDLASLVSTEGRTAAQLMKEGRLALE